MYSSPTLTTSGFLASTGTAALVGQLWLAVAFVVVGGMLLTVAKLLPRVAVEPVRGAHESRHHVRFTLNGRALRRRSAR
jgi:hypothetical protein